MGTGVAADGSGNVYVTGNFLASTSSPTADFNPGGSGGTLIGAGNSDIFLAKYNASGSFLWAKNMGGSGYDYGWGVVVDGSGSVYVTGNFLSGTADFNPGGSGGTLTNAGTGDDAFLAKYDASGNFLWAKGMGGSKSDNGQGVAVDGSSNVYVTGYFNSDTANFNPGGNGGTLTKAGSADIFLAKYDAGGNFRWAKNMGGSGSDNGRSVATDGSGNVYGTGHFNSPTANFNPGGNGGTLTTAGSNDVFVVKFGCSDTTSSYLSVSTCEDSYTLNDSVYMASGIYTQIFPNVTGCDSTVVLDLTLMSVTKPVINIDRFTLGVAGAYATYQWIKDNMVIPGATDSIYTVTANGNYRVVITNGKGCADTSDTYPVTNYTGVTDVHLLSQYINIYPNPATDRVYIQSPVKINIILSDVEGRTVQGVKNAHSVSLKNLATGIYLLRIVNENGVLLKVEKLVKAE